LAHERITHNALAWGGEEAGVRQTLHVMRDLVKQSDNYRIVKNTAAYLIKDINPRDYMGQVKAIFDYVQNSMRYVRDINKVEEISAPQIHLRNIAEKGASFGDCDDYSSLLVSLLRAVGFDTAFSAIATGRKGQVFDHVRAAVRDGGQWVILEATAKGRLPGWSLPKVREIMLPL